MLRRFLYFAVLLAALLAPPQTWAQRVVQAAGSVQTKDCTVYVTRTGHRYHKAGCRYLRRSAMPMSRSEAVRRGLTPCRVCGGSECEQR